MLSWLFQPSHGEQKGGGTWASGFFWKTEVCRMEDLVLCLSESFPPQTSPPFGAQHERLIFFFWLVGFFWGVFLVLWWIFGTALSRLMPPSAFTLLNLLVDATDDAHQSAPHLPHGRQRIWHVHRCKEFIGIMRKSSTKGLGRGKLCATPWSCPNFSVFWKYSGKSWLDEENFPARVQNTCCEWFLAKGPKEQNPSAKNRVKKKRVYPCNIWSEKAVHVALLVSFETAKGKERHAQRQPQFNTPEKPQFNTLARSEAELPIIEVLWEGSPFFLSGPAKKVLAVVKEKKIKAFLGGGNAN